MNKHLYIVIGLCMLLFPSVFGVDTFVLNAHNIPMPDTGGHNDIYFTQVNITESGTITNVTIPASSLASECILYDRNGGTPLLLNSSSNVGGICTFNQPVIAGQQILIGQWKGSYPSSYTFYATSSPQLPLVNETLIFKNTGYRDAGTNWLFDSQSRFLIESVGMIYDKDIPPEPQALGLVCFYPNDITLSTTSYTSIDSRNFTLNQEEDFLFISSINVNGSSNTILGQVTLNGVPVKEQKLRSVSTFDNVGSTGFNPFIISIPAGNNTVSVEVKGSNTNPFTISNIDYHFLSNTDNASNTYTLEQQNASYIVNTDSASIVYTPQFTSITEGVGWFLHGVNIEPESVSGVETMSLQLTSETTDGQYIERNFDAVGVGSALLHSVFESPNSDINVSGSSAGGSPDFLINGTMSFLSLNNSATYIPYVAGSNVSTDGSSTLTLGTGNHTLVSLTHTMLTGNDLGSVASISGESQTGAQKVTLYQQILNGSSIVCSIARERSFESTGEDGVFYTYNGCAPLSVGETYTSRIVLNVEPSETFEVYDEYLSSIETYLISTTENLQPPIVGSFIQPLNTAEVLGASVVKWTPFIDVNENLVNYTLYLINSSNEFILGTTPEGTETLAVNWTSYALGSYTLRIVAEDSTNLKTNLSISITITEPLINIVLEDPLNNSILSSENYTFEFSKDQPSLCTLFLNDVNSSETTTETFSDVSLVNGTMYSYYVSCENTSTLLYGNSSVFLFNVDTTTPSVIHVNFLSFDLETQSNVLLFIGLLFLYIMLLGFSFFFEIELFLYFAIVLGLILGFIVFPISWILTACFWLFNSLFLYEAKKEN